MQKSHVSLRDYEKNLIKDIKQKQAAAAALEGKKEHNKIGYNKLHQVTTHQQKQHKMPETEEHQRKLWDETGNFAVAQHKGHLVGLKRIYKPEVVFSRAVRKELKHVSAKCKVDSIQMQNYNELQSSIFEKSQPHLYYDEKLRLSQEFYI